MKIADFLKDFGEELIVEVRNECKGKGEWWEVHDVELISREKYYELSKEKRPPFEFSNERFARCKRCGKLFAYET